MAPHALGEVVSDWLGSERRAGLDSDPAAAVQCFFLLLPPVATASEERAAAAWAEDGSEGVSKELACLVGHLLPLGVVVVVVVERRVIAATVKTPTPKRTAIGMGEAAADRDHAVARERAGEGAGDAPKRARRAVPVGVGGQGAARSG
ncbi:hypothetical protein B0H13DRAFT_1922604 [Mycena leptocephala]|nr:hypothetical protein B0H13DRAFT_1922604 [Mycena leptocephala]